MGWKIFAVVNAGLLLLGIVDPHHHGHSSAVGILGSIVDIPAAIGLLLYAFDFRKVYSSLWRPFAWLFAGYSLLIVGLFIKNLAGRSIAGPTEAVAMVLALAIAVALQYFTWLALDRYSDERRYIPAR